MVLRRTGLAFFAAVLAAAALMWSAAGQQVPGQVSVYRVFVTERGLITALNREVDVWTVVPEGGYLLAALDDEEVGRLRGRALAVEPDPEQTGYLRTAGSGSAAVGALVPVTAVFDDTRYGTANGIHPSQPIAAGEIYVDAPPWSTSPVPVPLPMSAADGTFDTTVEAAEAVLDTSGLAPGRHILFVRGQDTDGDWGAVSAVFLDLFEPVFSDGFETGDTSRWTTGEP